ncbi:MAG: GntR family transcriptional regulator [Janthinobacterium lividum]
MPSDIRQRKFEVLATQLRDQIRRGVLKPGDRLPSLTEISMKSGITSPTIMRAHTLLEREGLITRQHGRGIFVASDVEHHQPAGPLGKTIVLLTPYGMTPSMVRRAPGWAPVTTAGVLETAHDNRHHAIMLHPDQMETRDIEWLMQQRPLGVIIDDSYGRDIEHLRLIIETFQNAGLPMVLLGNTPFSTLCDRVESDHEIGAYELTKWLIARGRRRIIMMRPQELHLDWAAKRFAGYVRAMEEAGLEALPAISQPISLLQGDTRKEFEHDVRQCASSMIEAMTGPTPCDALLTPSDGPAVYYAAACRLFGKKPNQDVILAGYDNYWEEVPERQWEQEPPAVTMDKNNNRIGKELAKLLIERVAGTLPPEPQVRLIPPTLVPVAESLLGAPLPFQQT